jgi:hypothetical protein
LNTGVATGNVVGTSTIITAAYGGLSGSATLNVNAATSVSFVVKPSGVAPDPLVSIPVSGTQQYAAIETFSDGTTQDRTKTSVWDAPGLVGSVRIATHAADLGANAGLFTGKVVGTTTINATHSTAGNATPATLSVNTATLVSFKVTPLTAETSVGGTQQYAAIETFSDGTTFDRTTPAAADGTTNWSTSGASAANASVGTATGVAFGITVTPADVPVVINATFTPSVGSALVATPANLTVVAAVHAPASCAGPGPLYLGTAANFGVLAGTALTITNPTSVTGDVGSPSITPAVGPDTLVGTKYDTASGSLVLIAKAVTDMETAVGCAKARPCDFTYGATKDFGGATLSPGVHCVTGAMSVGSSLTLTNPGVYIFRSTGALTTADTITVALGGTADATNTSIFWVPTTTTAGSNSIGATTTFLGTIMPDQSTAITLGANTTLKGGRTLSGAAVTLDKNTIAIPTY